MLEALRGDRPAGGVALAVISGLLMLSSFAPFGLWWAQWPAVAIWVYLARESTPLGAAWRVGLAWAVWLGLGLWWLRYSLHEHGGLPLPLTVLAIALLAVFLASFAALWTAGFLWFWRRWALGPRPVGQVLGLGLAWMLAELSRAQCLTGFPWLSLGYAHTDGWLQPWAPWLGIYGLNALSLAMGCGLALAWMQHRRWRGLLIWGCLLGATSLLPRLLPSEFTQERGEITMSLVQTAVPQSLKFDPDQMLKQMHDLTAQVRSAKGQVVVTPESVLPLALSQVPGTYLQALSPQGPQKGLLLGIFTGNEQEGFVNSLIGLSAGAALDYEYGKRHLLPFGEFVPPGFRWFVDRLNIPLGDQARGRQTQPWDIEAQRLRPLICYEDLFGEDFADAVQSGGATVLVNASNLAWFGPYWVQDQHLQFSRMRSLEFQRPLVRATNTGSTAAIDHRGQVLARLPAMARQVLEVRVQGRDGVTPYAWALHRFGLWPFWLVGLLMILGLARLKLRF